MVQKALGSKAALKAYLVARVGIVLDTEQLQTAANGATQWSRRLRELREEGWKISSHYDRSDLRPGQYMLEELPPQQADYSFAKSISQRVRAHVLERNGYTCQMCGIGAGDTDDKGQLARLHIGHVVDRSHGGSDEPSNLRGLCSACNQGAKNLTQEPPRWIWLLGQLRRATRNDQKKALEWLQSKFGDTL